MTALEPSPSCIRVLPPELIARIAAGEVIERPASVLKELVENALDAGARNIRCEIEAGGAARVRVSDDGQGMSPADLALAVQPHATSKLTEAADLDALQTLGFRGEALPSIASVSRFSLLSRRRPLPGESAFDSESNTAWRIDVRGGTLQHPEPRPAAGPFGTTVEAAELFAQLPARRKFLKSLGTEAAACADTLLRLALTRPDVAFALSQGRSELLSLPAAAPGAPAAAAPGPKLPARAYFHRAREALGRANSQDLIELDFADSAPAAPVSGCRLFGLLSPPSVSRPNRTHIYLTVNGRAVKDRTLTSALLEAFRHLLPPRRYPLGVLFLELPSSEVDINVHPAKSEVRFRSPGRIYALFHHAVRAACGLSETRGAEHTPRFEARDRVRETRDSRLDSAPVPDIKFEPSAPLLDIPSVASSAAEPFESRGSSLESPGSVWPRTATPRDGTQADRASEAPSPFGVIPRMSATPEGAGRAAPDGCRVIGQAALSYIVIEDESGVRLIDQHALHERILFERLLGAALEHARGDAQSLLVPETLELSAAQAALLSSMEPARGSSNSPSAEAPLELLAEMGFECESFGPRALLIRSVPAVLRKVSAARLVSELLDALLADDAESSGGKAPKRASLREKAAYVLSCKAAIKAGERLTAEQMEALLCEFQAIAGPLNARSALTCPHGRPLALEVSWYELERAVGRK